MKIIYVPDWMRAALAAADAPVQNLYSVDKLLGTLSPEDVANYIFLNENLPKFLPEPIVGSFELINLSGQLEGDECPSFKQVAKILGDYKVNEIGPSLDADGKQLTCDLMDEYSIRFTHVPLAEGDATDETARGEAGLMDRVIRQLYSFTPFHELAQLPLMAGYLTAAQQSLAPTYVS
jgi:hypothetical protein